LVFAQLRGMLSAEESSIVTQKNNHGGRGFPQRAQPDRGALRIRQRDIG
jgi:hypothetical protein